MVDKALPIAEVFYPGYSLLFLFKNAISPSVYVEDSLSAENINKKIEGKRARRNNCWYYEDGVQKYNQKFFKTKTEVGLRKKWNEFKICGLQRG